MPYQRINEEEGLILLKAQPAANAGTFAAPGITDWFGAFGIEGLTPDGEELENAIKCGKLGSKSKKNRVNIHLPTQFSFYLAGSGTPGTAPAWGQALRICGWREDIFADRVEYVPIDDNYEVGSLVGYIGPNKHPGKDMRGNVSFAITPKKQLIATVQLDGTYIANGEEAAHAVPDCNSLVDPLPVGPDHTTMSVFGLTDLDIYSMNIAGGRTVEFEEFLASRNTSIDNREMSGDIEFTAHKQSIKDWIAEYGTAGVINMVHGNTAGNIVEFNLPKVELGKFEYGTQGKYYSGKLPLNIMPLNSEDDMKIIVR